MFLHPVNVRCLVREYGSLEQSPERITATVVEIAGYSMSEVRARVVRADTAHASVKTELQCMARPCQCLEPRAAGDATSSALGAWDMLHGVFSPSWTLWVQCLGLC